MMVIFKYEDSHVAKGLFFGWHQRTELDPVGESHKDSQGHCNGSHSLGEVLSGHVCIRGPCTMAETEDL